jgi:CheY-like chemotaxis protein
VLKADDAVQALAVLSSGMNVDLLFTDVVMPGPLKSPDMARQAMQLLPHLKVLFTSGYTQNAIVHAGRLDEGIELLSKPYSREDLAFKLRQLLGSPADGVAAHPATGSKSHNAAPVHTILVVEDNAAANEALCELLGLLGHRVTAATRASDALTAIYNRPFDILLTDINLPDMSGLQLAERAASTCPSLAVIFASGERVPAPQQAGYTWSELSKPFTLGQLEAAIRSVMHSHTR